MTRPDLKACSITPSPAVTKTVLTVLVEINDIEIVFSTEKKYAKSSGKEEIYAGEEGLI